MKYETKVKWGKTFLAIGMALGILWLGSCDVPQAKAFSGDCAINALSKGRFLWKNFPGDTLGFGEARDYCLRAGGGVIDIGPGCESKTFTWPSGAGLLILKHYSTGFTTDPPISGGGGVGLSDVVAMKYGDLVASDYAATQAGIQAALDYVGSNGGVVILGAGTFNTTSVLWIHSNTHLMGQGIGITTIKRTTSPVGLPNDTGNIIATSKYGATVANIALSGGFPADSLANISISDLTIDGNYTAFPSANPNGPDNFGIRLFYVDHALISNVEVKNTLMTGIDLFGCRNGSLSNIWTKNTGMQLNLGSRNGINFNMNGNVSLTASTIWGKDFTIDNIHLENHKDTGFFIGNVSNLKISNVFDFCNHDSIYGNTTFEVGSSGVDISGYVIKGINISNVEAVGTTQAFWSNSISTPGAGMEDITISNCTAKFSVTRHIGTALNIRSSSSSNFVKNFTVSGCSFTNINSGNNDGVVASAGFVWVFGAGVYSSDIKVVNSTFIGAQANVFHSNNDGVRLGGKLYNVVFDNVTIRNAEAEGFNITTGASDVSSEITLKNCLVDGAQQRGYIVETLSTVSGVKILNCVAKDTNKNTLGPSFYLLTYSSGQTLKDIRVEGCRLIRTSGTNMRGLFIQKDAAATVDSVWVINNDFNKAASFPYNVTGNPTNVFWNDINLVISPPRLGPYSTSTTGGAIRIVDGVTFPITGAGIQSAINDLPNRGGTVILPADSILCGSTSITITKSNVILQGAAERATVLSYTGSGRFIVLGTDDGNHSGANAYDGVASRIVIKNLRIMGPGKTSTATAITDWDSGSNSFSNLTIDSWGYGYFGIGADVNSFEEVLWSNNGRGAYLGSRCDQNTFTKCYWTQNANCIWNQWAYGMRVISSQFVFSDTADIVYDVTATPAGSGDTRAGNQQASITGSWFENLSATSPPRHFQLGINGSSARFLTGLTVTGCQWFSSNADTFVAVQSFGDINLYGNGYSGAAANFIRVNPVSGWAPVITDMMNQFSSAITPLVGTGDTTFVYRVAPGFSTKRWVFKGGVTLPDGVLDTLRVTGRVDLNNSVIERQGADIASASNITLTSGTLYNITGNTTVTGITVPTMPTGKHYIVTFIITTTVQFTDGGNLNLNGNFNGDAAGGADRLTVDCDGTNCNEIGRAIN